MDCKYDHSVGKSQAEHACCYTDAELKAEIKRRKKLEIQNLSLSSLEEELAKREAEKCKVDEDSHVPPDADSDEEDE